ncbi:putative bifunctional diguanylate cyclase/phosphodiesterase [Boseongicola aestuarii]|uniref:Phytochrome-like protein cph2 n=1 Tax=Boseongicola aestuarii TaxID=1470561 RepID=A0A238IYE9_9RHOB|nr:EAL domain-containing protein [Boseongicola aestuarii]SMX23012.1 Phytochrome-like protein cph2 [Boseongicola aestuarii]
MGEVQLLQDRLLTALNGLEGPFAIWDKDFHLVVSNDAFARSLINRQEPLPPGTPLEDFMRLAAHSGLFEDSVGREEAWAEASAKALRAGSIRDITRFTNGRVHKATSHKTPIGDTLVIATDITELETARLARESYARQLEQAHEIAHHQAYHDSLTGLGNRRFLNEELARLSAIRRQNGGHITALHLDLDRFKQINDTRGHAVGDAVLCRVAEILRNLVLDTDTLVRTGGDEFVILRHCTKDHTLPPDKLADIIVAAFWRPVMVDGVEYRIGTSIGLASTDVSDEADLLTDSDIALYKAKSLGRGRAQRFDRTDFLEMTELKSLSDELLRGLDAREIIPFYQVQIDAQTGQPVGLEALARWRHPRLGLITPDRFLPIAEDLEVVDRIDHLVFETALAECGVAFRSVPPPSLSFNISHRRLMSRGVVEAAQKASQYPGRIAFELLESIFLDEQDDATTLQLDALRDAGVFLEVDDFGSGHASIIALGQVSPDRLKIDRRLIEPVTTSSRSAAMVRAIIDLAGALDIEVTAEGIETKAHADILRVLGCDRFQGFHFGRPALLDEVLADWWPAQSSRAANAS